MKSSSGSIPSYIHHVRDQDGLFIPFNPKVSAHGAGLGWKKGLWPLTHAGRGF